jgi:molybdopterin-containing oxidoreductase family membrane subunit
MALLAKLMAAASLACLWLYADELISAWLEAEATRSATAARVLGPYAGFWWGGVVLTAVVPQLLWLPVVRRNAFLAVAIGLAGAAGVWLDRFSLVVGGLLHDHMPRIGPPYVPTVAEWTLFLGTACLFTLLMLLFVRLLPVVSLFEIRHEESEAEVP